MHCEAWSDRGLATARRRFRARWAAVVLAVSLVVAGCGGGDERSATVADSTTERSAATVTDPHADVRPYELPPAREPRARIPSSPPPKRLRLLDLRPGRGEPVRRGDEVIVNYVGYLYATKERYDSSYSRLRPLPLKVVPGRGDFIEGFETGIVGMRVGGRRQMTIPPHMAYGDRGYAPVQPGDTVVFVVDLEAIVGREILDR